MAWALALGVLSTTPTIKADGEDRDSEARLIALTNATRVAHGVRALDRGWRLHRAALRHSHAMADAGRLYHGHTLVMQGRECWGQNVGVTARTMLSLHRAFMRSPPHRANILSRCFRFIGVAVVRRDGLAWVTLNFASAPRA